MGGKKKYEPLEIHAMWRHISAWTFIKMLKQGT